MHSIRQVVPLILGIWALSGAAGAVHAEEPAEQMPVLEEIMVTAQRKEESILDASASVTAFPMRRSSAPRSRTSRTWPRTVSNSSMPS